MHSHGTSHHMEVNQSPRKVINEVVVDCQDFNRQTHPCFGVPSFFMNHGTAAASQFNRQNKNNLSYTTPIMKANEPICLNSSGRAGIGTFKLCGSSNQRSN